MPSCSFSTCTNSSKTKSKFHGGITFHSFPPNPTDPVRDKWLSVVRQERKEPDWMPTNNSRVCSFHFRSEDVYTTNKGYRKLYKCAVPYCQNDIEEANLSPSSSMSPNSLDDVNIDSEPIGEKQRISILKLKLRKATMRNRRLVLDNHNLGKKIKILAKTSKSLKKAVSQLKKKIYVTDEQFTELPCRSCRVKINK